MMTKVVTWRMHKLAWSNSPQQDLPQIPHVNRILTLLLMTFLSGEMWVWFKSES